MSSVRLAVLGAGSVRCAIPVIGSLAVFFGERPLEISFYDSDEERLDLFDRFARLCFAATKANHSLRSTYDPAEALEDADKVIVQIGENCARKLLKSRMDAADPTDQALQELLPRVPEGAEVMSLMLDHPLPLDEYLMMEWPAEPTAAERAAIPHQVLRFLNGEEYLHEVFKQASGSPLRPWLDLPVRR